MGHPAHPWLVGERMGIGKIGYQVNGFCVEGQTKHINFFSVNFLLPTKTRIVGPRKILYVPHCLGKKARKGPT